MKDLIIIYPGRFQPFGPHHLAAYKHLQNKFNSEIYIVTSNTVNNESPFTFNEKEYVITQYGISAKNIILEKSPYSPQFINNFDPKTTALLAAYSAKDAGRLSYTKKDGTKGFYQKYNPNEKLESYLTHGYVYIIPEIKINFKGNELSGTYIRNFLKTCNEKSFQELFGWYDQKAYDIMKKKTLNEQLEEIMIGNSTLMQVENLLRPIINESYIDYPDLKNLEKYLDILFDSIGMDVDILKKHFVERINDYRNEPKIKLSEIESLFNKTFRRHRLKLQDMDDGDQAVMTDKVTNLNIPFVVEWDNNLKTFKLIAKTAIRKPGFQTGDLKLTVEAIIHNTKSLGIYRNQMPQIKNISDFINWMDGKVKYKLTKIPARNLKFTQRDLNTDTIKDIIKNNGVNVKIIVVSKDYYILDGHHRIAAMKHLDPDEKLNCLMVDLSMQNLLKLAAKYPKVSYSSIEEV